MHYLSIELSLVVVPR